MAVLFLRLSVAVAVDPGISTTISAPGPMIIVELVMESGAVTVNVP
jgi:hypothetical protein